MSNAADLGDQPTIDPNIASIARVYDAFLGGKDNYEVDRAIFRRVQDTAPQAAILATEHRKWLVRAVRFLAREAGIAQFLDCGCGLPTMENTHQVAQRANPEATVVYVDNDPMVAAHARVLLEENDRTHFAATDLTKPAELLNHPTVTKWLDWDRPIALMHCGTFPHLSDHQRPHEIMSAYIDALPSGSYVAMTHFLDPEDGGRLSALCRDIEQAFLDSTMGPGWFRTRDEITAFLDGLELVEPGWVRMAEWWPDGPMLRPWDDTDELILLAVARKP